MAIDAKSARIQISVNIDKPLQFNIDKPLQFPNGDIGKVTFLYVGLHRYCFTCKMISHDENNCPELTEDQREQKRLQRLALNNSGLQLQLDGYDHGHGHGSHGRNRGYGDSKESRDFVPDQTTKTRYHDNSHQRNKYSPVKSRTGVWSRLDKEYPPPRSSRRGKSTDLRTNMHYKGGEQKRAPTALNRVSNRINETHYQEWRPRENQSYTKNQNRDSRDDQVFVPSDMNRGTPVPARAEQEGSDSQRTISEHPDNNDNTGAHRSGHLVVHRNETEDEKRMRLKGKAIMSSVDDTPMSKEKNVPSSAMLIGKNTIIIREPSVLDSSSQQAQIRQTEERAQGEKIVSVVRNTGIREDVTLDDDGMLDEEQANKVPFTVEDEAEVDRLVSDGLATPLP
ncbi:hypothetical protein Bca4012_004697 [Brassica carinata]